MNGVLNQLSISSIELSGIGVDPATWAYLDVYQRARLASIVLRGRNTMEGEAAASLLDYNNQNALHRLQLIHGRLPVMA